MSEHPASFRLDAHALGDPDDLVAQHLASCDPCRSYVAALGAEANAFTKNTDGLSFIERLETLDDRRPAVRATSRRNRVLRLSFAIVPVLAAALVLLLVRSPSTSPSSSSAALDPPRTERFKGKVQLSVVRERAGEQKRFAAELLVRPGDRVRLEVAVDDAQPVVAGILGKDGSWLVLLAPSLLEAGTHFSERAARFDETPTEGWFLAGDPEAVELARSTRDFARVAAVSVAVEPR